MELGEERTGRWRFDTFYWSWINVFMVISGDSWNEIMYDTVKATGHQASVLFYVTIVTFGTYVILNLFVAILLSQMGSEESVKHYQRESLIKYAKEMFEMEEPEESQVFYQILKC